MTSITSLYEDVYYLLFNDLSYLDLKNVFRTCKRIYKCSYVKRFQQTFIDKFIIYKVNLGISQYDYDRIILNKTIIKYTDQEIIAEIVNTKIYKNNSKFLELFLISNHFKKLNNIHLYDILYHACYHNRDEIVGSLLKHIPKIDKNYLEIDAMRAAHLTNHKIYNYYKCSTKYLELLIEHRIIDIKELYDIFERIDKLIIMGILTLNNSVMYNINYILRHKIDHNERIGSFDELIVILYKFIFPYIINKNKYRENYTTFKSEIIDNDPLVLSYNSFIKLLVDYTLNNNEIITILDISRVLDNELKANNFQLALYIITSCGIYCTEELLIIIVSYSKNKYIEYLYNNGYFLNDLNSLFYQCCKYDRSEIIKILLKDSKIDLVTDDNLYIKTSAYHNSKKTLSILINLPVIKNTLNSYQQLEYAFKLKDLN